MRPTQSRHYILVSSVTAVTASATLAILVRDRFHEFRAEDQEDKHDLGDSTVNATAAPSTLVAAVANRIFCAKERSSQRHLWWEVPSSLRPSFSSSKCDENRMTTTSSTPSITSFFPSWSGMDRSAQFSKRMTNSVSQHARLTDLYKVHWDTPLGEGGFGSVFCATDQSSGERVACKQMSKKYTDDVAFQREMEAFLHLREHGGHPNICSLKETFDEGNDYYLILDLILGGEMFDHLINHGAYSEADAARLVREIASALAFLHGTGCVHGDLKPENIMLSSRNSSDAVVKLIDFGCAQLVGRDDLPVSDIKTEAYCPPEVLKHDEEQSAYERNDSSTKTTCSSASQRLEPSADMWALGVILYIMLTGYHPFDLEGNSPDSLIARRILNNAPIPMGADSKYTAHLSESAIDLIQRLLAFDPEKRISALEMLDHPWVSGLTASVDKITDIDKKLSKFRVFKSGLEAKVFADLFHWSEHTSEAATKKTSLIERSFKSFDEEHKGFITGKDLKRRLHTGEIRDDSDEEKLTLSNFEALLSESMRSKYFPRGHVVYREGDEGNEMFFVNSGVMEVFTKDGFRQQIEQGDFVGEGALLSPNKTRSATVHCLTPVHVIAISREQFEKYLSASHQDINLKIREKGKARMLARTKAILRQQKELRPLEVDRGTTFYNVGDEVREIYIVEKGKVDVRASDGTTVFSIDRGGLFGERAVIESRPRTTSTVCTADKCFVHVMNADAFRQVLKDSPCLHDALTNVSRRREFQRAVVFHTKQPFPTTTDALREVFDLVDADKSGRINLDEIRIMLKDMDPSVPEEEIQGVLKALDIDETNGVNFEEFKLLFGMDATK